MKRVHVRRHKVLVKNGRVHPQNGAMEKTGKGLLLSNGLGTTESAWQPITYAPLEPAARTTKWRPYGRVPSDRREAVVVPKKFHFKF